MENNNLNDLVLKAKQGDKKAFEVLYETTKSGIYFMCRKYADNEQDAQDLTSDTYVSALEKLSSLENPEYFVTWLNRIAINKCKNFLKHKKPSVFTEREEEKLNVTEEIADEFLPAEYAENNDRRRQLMDIIENDLSDVQRMTVVLFYYNSESIQSIAEIMECSQGTVKSRLNSAKKTIKAKIEEKHGGIKNFALVGLPLAFGSAAHETIVPASVSQSVTAALYGTAAGAASVAGAAAKTGLSLGAKIGIGVAAAVVVVGGAIAAITAMNGTGNNITVPAESYTESSRTTSSDTSESNTDTSEKTDEESKTTETSKSSGYDFEYMDIQAPKVPSGNIETVAATTYTGSDGKSVPVNAYRTVPDFDLNYEKAKAVIEASDLYKNGYEFNKEDYIEDQELMVYEVDEENVVFKKFYITQRFKALDKSIGDELSGIEFTVGRDVSSSSAPNKISLTIDGAPTTEKQKLAYDVLVSVIGEEQAKYLVYDDADDWDVKKKKYIKEIYSENQKVCHTFTRTLKDDQIEFELEISLSTKQNFEYYSGDYTSIYESVPVKFEDVLSEKAGNRDIYSTDFFLDDYMKAIDPEHTRTAVNEIRILKSAKADGTIKINLFCDVTPTFNMEIISITNGNETKIQGIKISGNSEVLNHYESDDEATANASYTQLLDAMRNAVSLLVDGVDCTNLKYDASNEKNEFALEGNVEINGTELPYELEVEYGVSLADLYSSAFDLVIGDV